MIYYIIYAVAGYLIGSIPFGYIIVKLVKGIDIRTVGSGNIGATNVGRIAGWPWGILCFLLDAAKGFIPTFYIVINNDYSFVLWGISITYTSDGVILSNTTIGIPIALGIILGHLFPVYIRFRGGKGVATGLGVFLALFFLPTTGAVVVWLIFLLILRYVSLASIMAVISLPLWFAWMIEVYVPRLWSDVLPLMIFCIAIAMLVIIKHIPNIKRLIKGTEPKVRLWGNKPQINTDEHR
ncbi:MAG: glycerol-3-phosphate 1-O-acyltransferase PlsY [Planctomycetota bacterium]|nr:glycerol-3-phosphate 1-O-acyltransferase PlsY [Planctomycetota bacterium]MDI6787453.1 glycerol-3-phosphate 1-O-acyltransferase PlsY [Planctomycetota bacterium]